MKLRYLKVWLPCLHVGLASALLFLGHAQNLAHQIELRRANVRLEFDYFPRAFQWLVVVYAPSGLLTFPVAAIPGIPKFITAIWFIVCVGAFWYWLALQIMAIGGLEAPSAPRKSIWGKLFNWLGFFVGLLLCLLSASAAWRGGGPLLADVSGFLWGVGLSTLFVRNIRKMRWGLPFPRSAP